MKTEISLSGVSYDMNRGFLLRMAVSYKTALSEISL